MVGKVGREAVATRASPRRPLIPRIAESSGGEQWKSRWPSVAGGEPSAGSRRRGSAISNVRVALSRRRTADNLPRCGGGLDVGYGVPGFLWVVSPRKNWDDGV